MSLTSLLLLFLILLFLVIIWVVSPINTKSKPKISFEKSKGIITFTLILGLVFFIFAILSPFLFTSQNPSDFEFSAHTGATGDTFGIMNPFIALVGIALTFLAFYIQKIANDEIKKQFQIQQFESQFFEMLKLHKENVNEMRIEGYLFSDDSDKSFNEQTSNLIDILKKISKKTFDNVLRREEKVTSNRKVFKTMHTEFECLLDFFKKHHLELSDENVSIAYRLFFFGFDALVRRNKNYTIVERELQSQIDTARHQHQNIRYTRKNRKIYKGIKLYFNYKPFAGHSSRLGHYYRHLYLMVKFVDESKIILEYEDKMKYLKILRAQLSNYEQIMLFYNWLGGYGKDWENENRRFFTKYKMIHNVWLDLLYKDAFIKERISFLENRFNENNLKGAMFEENE